MTKTKTKALAITAAAVLTAGIAGAALSGITDLRVAEALDATSEVTYPFEKGANAFQYAPTITSSGSHSDTNDWEFCGANFDTGNVAMRAGGYLVAQFRMDGATAALSLGVTLNNGADRYVTKSGNPVYFLSEAGNLTQATIQGGNDVSIASGFCGAIIIPITSLGSAWGVESNAEKAYQFFTEANRVYVWDYSYTLGEVFYYNGEIGAEDTTLTKLVDLSKGERAKSTYYKGNVLTSISFPGDKAMPRIPYAFAEGTDAYKNTVNWKPTAANQTLTVNFDETADISDATHLLVQYFSTQAPRLQYTLKSSDGKSSSLKNGARVFFMAMGANYSDLYVTANASGASFGNNKGKLLMGMIVIPIEESLTGSASLDKVSSLQIKTTGATDVVIGGVASYTAERGDGAYAGGTATALLSLSETKFDKFTASAADTLTELQVKPNINNMYGDSTTVTQDVTYAGQNYNGEWSGTEDQNTASLIWIGGSYGKVEMTEDSYGEDALKFTATGATGNGYTSTTDLGSQFSWENKKGVALWARNDSDIEVSFNLELECTAVVTKGENKQVASDRFNITQGNRFYLYDINTGKTSIYMTRPTATLPAGFEGWVFIPFTAFDRASWSNNGVTSELFMGDNTYVNYMVISIEAAKNLNASFSLNNIGAYAQTPSFDSVFVNGNGNTIPELLGLSAQEEN